MEKQTKIIVNQDHYKFLILFCMLYCAALLLSGLYVYRPVVFDGYDFTASSLIYPMSYIFNDIICEVYGYQNSRRLIWFGLITIFFFALITKLLDTLPHPTTWKHQADFLTVLGPYLRLSFAGLASMVVGEFINIIAMSKWKALLKGKLFWLRSLGSTSIGAAIDTTVEYIVAFAGIMAFGNIIKVLLAAYFFRICYAFIMTIPSSIIVIILKRVEKVDAFKPVVTYNPFSLN